MLLSNLINTIREGFPPKALYNPEKDIPDLTGKVAIVTGGNSGIGFETCKWLLKKNATVYMAARSVEKAQEAIVELEKQTTRRAHFLELDLASVKSVTKTAKAFMSQESELHMLYNNGGVMLTPIEKLTSDGYDLQFGTNVLGHALLTLALLPVLLSTTKVTPEGKVRVINVSSSGIYTAPSSGINWETLGDTPERVKLGSPTLYSQSKFGNLVFSNELARRYADQGIVSTAVNPGNIRTNLWRNVPSPVQVIMNYVWLHPVELGVMTQLWAGTSPECADFNGKYLIPWARVGNGRVDAKSPEMGTKLWEWIEGRREIHG